MKKKSFSGITINGKPLLDLILESEQVQNQLQLRYEIQKQKNSLYHHKKIKCPNNHNSKDFRPGKCRKLTREEIRKEYNMETPLPQVPTTNTAKVLNTLLQNTENPISSSAITKVTGVKSGTVSSILSTMARYMPASLKVTQDPYVTKGPPRNLYQLIEPYDSVEELNNAFNAAARNRSKKIKVEKVKPLVPPSLKTEIEGPTIEEGTIVNAIRETERLLNTHLKICVQHNLEVRVVVDREQLIFYDHHNDCEKDMLVPKISVKILKEI